MFSDDFTDSNRMKSARQSRDDIHGGEPRHLVRTYKYMADG